MNGLFKFNTFRNLTNSKLRAVIFFVLSLLDSFSCVYANNWFPLNVLSTSNGLPTDEVKQVYQDKEGYIWIATSDGLCRYDSYQLKIYKDNLYTPNLLSSNKINTIAEDENHNLWIGTINGLNILNKITGEIKQIPHEKLRNNNIQVILTTKNNSVWIGTANGLLKYIEETNSFECYDNANTNYQLPGNDIKTLIEDHKGNIWIGTWNDGIARFNATDNKFYPYPKINQVNSAHIIFEDDQFNIWVGSWGYGLFKIIDPYDLQKVKYINYRHNHNDPASLSDDIVYAISQDRINQEIWIGTRSGLSILNDSGNTKKFINHLPNQSSDDLLYNEVNSIIRDRSGLMWLGTLGGGVSIVNTQKRMFNLRASLKTSFF